MTSRAKEKLGRTLDQHHRIARLRLSLLRKMFNLAELWGLRPDGTNPCRHVQKYTGQKRTRLINDEELVRLYAYLDRADAEGLEHPVLTLAIRLQFEFAARMSEVLELRRSGLLQVRQVRSLGRAGPGRVGSCATA